MSFNTSSQHNRFIGFQATPPLFKNFPLKGIDIFHLASKVNWKEVELPRLRLGQLVERFVFATLEEENNIDVIAKNLQIIKNKVTLGELDALLKNESQMVHLEIVYKFYLYDGKVGSSELEHWIGPNRKDNLIKKLTKLKEKQFPLLYQKDTEKELAALGLNTNQFKQKALFKAQLFVPFENPKQDFQQINKECVQGFYINYEKLSNFKDFEFFLPEKLDWLIAPHENVTWTKYLEFESVIQEHVNQRKSPLCWFKNSEGQVFKCFVTFW